MAPGDAIAAAQAALLDAGLINLAIIDAQARVIAVEGSLLADWRAGDSVVERLLVLAGMEPVIAAMAKGEPGARPLDLPAVFIGGNHEDGGPGVSLRLAPLDLGRVLLLLRPLENAAAMDQVSVQQHNDLALLRGQLEQATSQAALNETAREALFDTLRWSFRAPLAGLVQATEGTALDGPAREALDAVDDWLALLDLRAQHLAAEGQGEGNGSEDPPTLALRSIKAEVAPLFPGGVALSTATAERAGAQAQGAASLLVLALRALSRSSGSAQTALVIEDTATALRFCVQGPFAASPTDHRIELARSAVLLLGGGLDLTNSAAVLSLPLSVG